MRVLTIIAALSLSIAMALGVIAQAEKQLSRFPPGGGLVDRYSILRSIPHFS
jgi:hypothetical protein